MDNQNRIPVPEYYNLPTVCQSAEFWEAVAIHKMSGADLQVYNALAGQVHLPTGITTEINIQEMQNTLNLSYESLRLSLKKWQDIGLVLRCKGKLRRYYHLPDVVKVGKIFADAKHKKAVTRANAFIKIEMGKYRKKHGSVPEWKERAIREEAHEKFHLEPSEQTEAPQETPVPTTRPEGRTFSEIVNESRKQRGLPPLETVVEEEDDLSM